MATYFKKGKHFAVAFRLQGRKRECVYGIKTERLAREIKAQKDREETLSRAGLLQDDPATTRMAAARQQPIEEHVKEFEQFILARNRTAQHAQQQASHVRRLLGMARVRGVTDIRLEHIQVALFRLRGDERGPRTCNAARGAVVQFERWLKRTGRVQTAVLHDLERFNEEEDIRRARRALEQVEVDFLLSTTAVARDRGKSCGICPRDRAMLYATGLGTGFRRRALLSLQKSSFVLAQPNHSPFIRLTASNNKKRRAREQVISRDLADRLRVWLEGKPDQGPVWCPKRHADLAARFRRDMDAAREAYVDAAATTEERRKREEANLLRYRFHDGERDVFADFHGLRHTGITFIVRTHGLRVGQAWADHSTPVLTARYAHVGQEDLVTAAKDLPTLTGLDRQRPPRCSA